MRVGGWWAKLWAWLQGAIRATHDRELKREEMLLQHASDEDRKRYARQKLVHDYGYIHDERNKDKPFDR